MPVIRFGDLSKRRNAERNESTLSKSSAFSGVGKTWISRHPSSLIRDAEQANKGLVERDVQAAQSTQALLDVADSSSDHSSEAWDDEVPDDYGSEDDELQELGKPSMEEDTGTFTGQDRYDEDGNLIREEAGGVNKAAQEKAARADKRLQDNRKKHGNRFKAIIKRYVLNPTLCV
ncbi:MAG: hypothetical protein Q9166_002167 [cf. Caloplaca sp. 2 TL-2023]